MYDIWSQAKHGLSGRSKVFKWRLVNRYRYQQINENYNLVIRVHLNKNETGTKALWHNKTFYCLSSTIRACSYLARLRWHHFFLKRIVSDLPCTILDFYIDLLQQTKELCCIFEAKRQFVRGTGSPAITE